jgi:hypothetical protein
MLTNQFRLKMINRKSKSSIFALFYAIKIQFKSVQKTSIDNEEN